MTTGPGHLRCSLPALGAARETTIELDVPLLDGELERRLATLDRRTFVVADRGALDRPLRADVVVPGGEVVKTWEQLGELLRALSRAGVDRGSLLVAVGGGATGDLCALAASLHLRGIDLLLVPTTLLAMVDSSVGGKTAVNLPEGKNLVGTFWPAQQVWIDPRWLRTLPDAEFRSGLGEVAKVAVGLDATLWELLARDRAAVLAREPATLRAAIERCLLAKIDVVTRDPLERGPRRLLNLGHTLGHALEARAGFRLPHGVAVARGIHHVLDLAAARGELDAPTRAAGHALLDGLGLPAEPLPPAAELLPYLGRDKKMRGGELTAVLPIGRGESRLATMPPAAFLSGV
ncbi:MAG: 3-dehydroquinate synthase [Planctomycetes bacterium]|nr:3-dehydroquinate synthase [Planctomycetota bacterium]